MELKVQKQTITINEVIFDGQVEQPIECDALLPDYCPDIVGILKCTVSTHISSSAVNSDRLTIEGSATAHIYYTSDNGAIRHAEYKIPFAKLVELRSMVRSPVVTVVPSVDYVNCRAVNQRRIDLRGALKLHVTVSHCKEQEVICDANGRGLQLRRDMISTTEVVGQTSFSFAVNEELELGFGKGQVGSIIRSDCRVHMQDYKIIAGKIVVKGDFMLHVLYQPLENEGNLEVMEYSLPISQIVDADGVDESCICDVKLMVASCDVHPKASEDGEYRILALDVKLVAQVKSHRHKEIPVASDCYSTNYQCGCKHQDISFLRLIQIVNESIMHKTTLDLPEDVDSVLDTWCEISDLKWKYDNKQLQLALRLTVSMFAKMQDGKCLYFEQGADIEHNITVAEDLSDIKFEPSGDVLSSAYNLVGKEKIDIRCDVLIKGCVYSVIKHKAMAEIMLDESVEKKKEANKLYIYYADSGESIWDIAKQYNTSADAIWEENEIDQDKLPLKKMLLIPII